MAEHFKIGTHSLQLQKVQMAESYQNTENLEKTKKQFQRVLAGTPPSKESRNIVFFLFFQGFYQVWGTSRKLA